MAFRHIKKLVSTRTERVKSLEFHPTEPLLAAGMYDGTVQILNTNDWSILRLIRVDKAKAIRCVCWMPSMNWLLTACDNFSISAYQYNTGALVATKTDAHKDFIRHIAIHPTEPLILSCSDDGKIKLYRISNSEISFEMEYEGHEHFVMDVKFNPKDPSSFASASLDGTVKFWGLTSKQARYSLKGHTSGVNCIEFHPDGGKPYIVSGGDDYSIKLWDYHTKSCISTLEGHTGNVTSLKFHPYYPLLLSTGEDNILIMWNSLTMAKETVFDYQKKRGWTIDIKQNIVAVGYDEGMVVLRLGRDNVLLTMNPNLEKVFYARNNEIKQIMNLTNMDEQKDFATSDIFPSTIALSTDYKYLAVCGDNEFVVSSALVWRFRASGSAKEFAWGIGDTFATRESRDSVSIWKNFQNQGKLSLQYDCERIFGGALLGICCDDVVTFYQWDDQTIVRQIDVKPTGIWWSQFGDVVAIATNDTLFMLQYNSDYREASDYEPATGSSEAFQLINEIEAKVKGGTWYNDTFFYNDASTVNFTIGNQVEVIARTDKPLTLVGYGAKTKQVLLCDTDFNFVTYSVPIEVLDFISTAISIASGDGEDMELDTDSVPDSWKSKLCAILEGLDFLKEAMELADTDDKRFELALKLNDLQSAIEIATKSKSIPQWRHLTQVAIKLGQIDLLEQALQKSGDENGLLLLKSCKGNKAEMKQFAETSKNTKNVSFAAYFASGCYDKCIDILLESGRAPEAALMARTYRPDLMEMCAKKWQELLIEKNEKRYADAIALPSQYPNLFGLEEYNPVPPTEEEKDEQIAPQTEQENLPEAEPELEEKGDEGVKNEYDEAADLENEDVEGLDQQDVDQLLNELDNSDDALDDIV